ncbi:MAG: hypothetical protein IIV87_05565, partial [Oscillospiraceae bacterium]|nr:hypothetical protein [Oscillospiraceae bacterium]
PIHKMEKNCAEVAHVRTTAKGNMILDLKWSIGYTNFDCIYKGYCVKKWRCLPKNGGKYVDGFYGTKRDFCTKIA